MYMYIKSCNYYYKKKVLITVLKIFQLCFAVFKKNLYHFNLANAMFILKLVIEYRQKYGSV